MNYLKVPAASSSDILEAFLDSEMRADLSNLGVEEKMEEYLCT